MSEIKRVAKTFVAYLRRPDLYPELGRKIVKNVFNRNAAFKGKEKTLSWASSVAVSQEAAVKSLFGREMLPFSEVFCELYIGALEKQNACPVKMGGAGALELIYAACEFSQATAVIETGVAYGWSSLAALQSLQKRQGVLYSSDMPYLSQEADQYVGTVVPEDLKQNWKLFRFADRESLPKIFAQQNLFDVVHYDSDKAYEGMFWAYGKLYQHLRQGGVFISDDINDNSAFQDFCETHAIKPTVVSFEGKFIGIFIK